MFHLRNYCTDLDDTWCWVWTSLLFMRSIIFVPLNLHEAKTGLYRSFSRTAHHKRCGTQSELKSSFNMTICNCYFLDNPSS